MIETEGLTHLHLRVRDRERFRDAHLVFLNTPGSGDTITLNPEDGPVGGGGVDHFGFRLKPGVSIDEAVAAVEAAGGRLARRGERSPGIEYAYVADPDGYMIEL